MITSSERWAAARRVFELCPEAAEDLDICLKLQAGRVRRRAFKYGWLNSEDSASLAGGLPRREIDLADKDHQAEMLGAMVKRFAVLTRRQIAELESQNAEDASAEARIRSLAVLAKTLQTLEDLQKRAEKAADDRLVEDEDLLEIHGRLARKIEAIVQRENGE